jgi:hypothetical protein
MARFAVMLAVAVLLAGCSGAEKRDPLTKRQRDSTIAGSPLPGAKTVGKALEHSDSAAVRRERLMQETE